jgi:tetratricopeptide (TPR) repeat protein
MKRFRFLFPLLSLLFFVQAFQQPVTAQINTDRMMLVGRNALYFEDYVLAIQYFNQVISAKPHLAEPYFYRAVAKLYLEDYRGAEEDCSKAIELNPFLSKAYLCRSYARLNLKTYEAAAEDCRKGLEFDQEDKTLMQNLALSQLYAKQYDEAEKTLRELIKRSPNYVYAYMISGQLKVEKGDTLGAVEEFSRAVASDRHFAPAYAARGMSIC